MKIDFLHSKLYTVFLTIFYIFGLCAVFFERAVVFSFCVFIILIFFTIFNKNASKKIILLYLIFFLGIIRGINSQKTDNFIDEINANDAQIKGRVVSSKNISSENKKMKFYVKADEIRAYNKKFDNLDFKILVNTEIYDNLDKKVEIGDIVEFEGKLRTPYASSNPYQFDYKKYLLNNDCKYILYAKKDGFRKIKSPKLSKNLSEDWFFILNKFELTRNKILEAHAKNIKSPRLEILGGIVFGNETINPDEEIKENFRHSGLLHLLAASGLNVALIFGIWWWSANLLKLPYNFSIFLGAVFVVFYTFMTGFPPSILRASLMLLFVLLGKLIDRRADSVALIFFVAFLVLLFSPKMLYDIGFQLSFTVTFGLIFCVNIFVSKFDKLDKKFKEKYKKLSRFKKYFFFIFSPKSLFSIVAVPLVAQMWVIPLQMHYFNNLAPFSLLANIAVVPFIGILSFIGFVSSIIALIPKLNGWVVYLFDLVANPLLALLINISKFFASFKFSLIPTQGLNFFQMLCFWSLILFFTFNLKQNFKNKKQKIALFVCFILFLLSFIKFDYFKNELQVIAFDVGNADSFLIKTPKNKFFLIDTGKKPYQSFSSATSIINPYFLNERIKTLDGLIVTHFDLDHAGGVIDILENNRVNKIYIQKEEAKSKTSQEILKYLKEKNLDYKVAKNNEIIYSEPDLEIKTFVPDVRNGLNQDKIDNETSIIVLLTYKNKNFLFMADAGVEGFRRIDFSLPLKIDVLKIGHHGAKETVDKKMLELINPDYAIISTGFNNFSHPHYSTLNLLDEFGIKTLSTKDYGFLKIILNSKGEFRFLHFDRMDKKIKPVLFDKKSEIPFNKSDYVQKFILEKGS